MNLDLPPAGDMRGRIAALDWSRTPIGPATGWPQPLRTLLDVILGSSQPMFIAWGPDHTLLYNDAYGAILAGKHPGALGRSFLEVWQEIRGDLLPIVEQALRGEAVTMDDITLIMERRGYAEEAHFAFSYTPVRDAGDVIAGFFCVCQETTAQVMAERRLHESEARARRGAERVRLALDAGAIIGTWLWDLPTDRFTVDEAFAQAFGLDPALGREGLSLEEVISTVHPEDRSGLAEAISEAIGRGGRYAHQYRVRRADGRYYWIEANGRVDKGPDGTPLSFPGVLLDVEERRRAEQGLREATRRFDAILSNTREAVFLMDHNQHCVYANAAAETLTGYRFEEMQGRPLHDVVHHKRPDGSHYPLDECPIDRAFPACAQMSGEELFVARDGSFYPVAFPASPVLDDEGRPVGTVIEARGIAEEKARDDALRESEERFRNMADHAPVMMWVTDETGHCTYLNRVWYEFTGQTEQEALGLGWLEATHPDDKDEAERVFLEATARGIAFRIEYRLRRADGAWRWAIDAAAPRFGAKGEFLGFIGSVIDIDDRRIVEERLRESEERYRTLFETIESGFCIAQVREAAGSVDYRVIEANPAFFRQTGFPEAIVGRWLREAAPMLEEHWFETYGRVARTGEPVRFEQPSEMLGRWFDVYAFRQGDPAEGRIGILFNDITARRNAEVALRELNETLEHRVEEAIAQREQAEEALRQSQKMEAVGQLTGGIAHDFNNMLAAVVGSLDLLGRRIGDGDPRARRYVDGAMEGARRAALLTQRLLAFSRQQPLRPEPVDVNRLVQGMSDLLSRSLGAGVRLETVLSGGLWRAHADPNQLENVILNLAVNARDAMAGAGRLTIETGNAHLDSHYGAGHLGVAPGQYIQIAVSDTGTGMTPEVIAKAFDPFFTTKPVGQGTGLGLSQVYGFVRQSGGHVKIYSEPGQGTTVKVYLPRLLGAPVEEAEEAVSEDLPRGEAQEVVLVAEDEEMVRRFTVEALAELGYRVLEAPGGQAALRLLDAHPEVTLLFTDIVMPDMNGRQLADEALRRRPGLKVLFTTGYTRNAVVHNGVLDPGVQLIGKPFTVEELAAKLREVLDGGA